MKKLVLSAVIIVAALALVATLGRVALDGRDRPVLAGALPTDTVTPTATTAPTPTHTPTPPPTHTPTPSGNAHAAARDADTVGNAHAAAHRGADGDAHAWPNTDSLR